MGVEHGAEGDHAHGGHAVHAETPSARNDNADGRGAASLRPTRVSATSRPLMQHRHVSEPSFSARKRLAILDGRCRRDDTYGRVASPSTRCHQEGARTVATRQRRTVCGTPSLRTNLEVLGREARDTLRIGIHDHNARLTHSAVGVVPPRLHLRPSRPGLPSRSSRIELLGPGGALSVSAPSQVGRTA